MGDDLERHRLRRRFHGFPIYDDEGDEVIDVIVEPEWEWDALTEDQQATIRRETMGLQRGRELTWDEAFPFMLGEYGIRCPHSWVAHEPTWRECRWCRCAETLPGRVVDVGGRVMRVPEPPPRVLRIPIPAEVSVAYDRETSEPTTATMLDVEEYEWTGSRYHLNAD